MPFWKKEKKAAAAQENGGSNGTTASNGSNSSGEGDSGAWVKDPKVNYKARLEHKQYLVSRENDACSCINSLRNRPK